jgi:hypothetical protein
VKERFGLESCQFSCLRVSRENLLEFLVTWLAAGVGPTQFPLKTSFFELLISDRLNVGGIRVDVP